MKKKKGKEVVVLLKFKNKGVKDFFMSGLSDGFGENECSLKWKGAFKNAKEFEVQPFDCDDDGDAKIPF